MCFLSPVMSGAAVKKRLKHLSSDLVPVIRRMSPRTLKKARLSSLELTTAHSENRPDQNEVECPKVKRKGRAMRTPDLSSPSRKKRGRPRKTQSDVIVGPSVPDSSRVDGLAESSEQGTNMLDRSTAESVQLNLSSQNTIGVTSPSMRTSVPIQSLMTNSCCNGETDTVDSPEEAYPLPRTAKQKEKSHLARQKQLEDMRAREAAAAREERFQRRKGVWVPPCKKNNRKTIMWKEDKELTDLYVYSPPRESSAGP